MNFVFDLKWAQTLDGQLADDNDLSQWISGPQELTKTHELRSRYDAVLVGSGTYLKDLSLLTVRHVPLPSGKKQPVRIILDRGGRISRALQKESAGELRVSLATRERPTIIVMDEEAPRGLLPSSVSVISSPLDFEAPTDVVARCLTDILERAEKSCQRSLREILVEGGPTISSRFLDRSLHRFVYVSVSPVLTGGQKNRISLNRPLSQGLRLEMVGVEILGPDVMVKFRSPAEIAQADRRKLEGGENASASPAI